MAKAEEWRGWARDIRGYGREQRMQRKNEQGHEKIA